MRHLIATGIVLAAIWLANSGIYTAMVLSFGGLSLILVVWLIHRMDVVDHESLPLHLTMRLPAYYAWLIREIFLSNVDMVKRIWGGNTRISPTVVELPVAHLSDMGKVIYGNSITLTPGTVVMDLQDNMVRVHSISREGVDALLEGEMDRRVGRLEQ